MNDITTDIAQLLARHKGDDLVATLYEFEVAKDLVEVLKIMGVLKESS